MSDRFPERCVLLSPHLDDLAFSLGAALLDGRFVSPIVVNVFTVSSSAIDGYGSDVSRVSVVRADEDRAFFQRIDGAVDLRYLGRLDAPHRLRIADEDVFDPAAFRPDDPEARALRAALAPLRSTAGDLVAPLGLGGHVDHRVVADAACALARDGWPILFYEDLPYAADLDWAQVESSVRDVEARIGRALEPRVLHSSGRIDKEAAVRTYRSQADARTIERIMRHGRRTGTGALAERVWCDPATGDR